MKPKRAAFLSLGILAACFAVPLSDPSLAQGASDSARPAANKQQQTPKASAGKDVVIGYLESRDRTVTILRSSQGTVYTIKTKDGKTLAKKLKDKDLQAKYPGLYDQIKYGVAGNDATLRPISGHPQR
jgi:hypothetical protein